jgi:hypothetical protein
LKAGETFEKFGLVGGFHLIHELWKITIISLDAHVTRKLTNRHPISIFADFSQETNPSRAVSANKVP